MYNSSFSQRPDGTRVSEASIPDFVTPSTQPTNDDWLKKILDRTEEMYAREGRPPSYSSPFGGSKGTNAMSGRPSTSDAGHNMSPQARGLDALSMLAKRKQLEAMMGPAPTRITTFASGAINGYVPDTNAMNGFQREIFLPQNAAQEKGGLSDGQINAMSPAGMASSWEAKMQNNPDSVQNQQSTAQLMDVIRMLQQQLGGRR